MARRKAVKWWKTKVGNCEVTPQAIWHIAKSLTKRDGSKAPNTAHGPLGITSPERESQPNCRLLRKSVYISWPMWQQPWATGVDNSSRSACICIRQPLGKIRLCNIQKLVKTLKQRKACGLNGIPDERLSHLPRRPLVHLTHLLNHCLRLSDFPKPRKEAEVITLPKASKVRKLPKNLRPISLLSTTDNLFDKVILKIFQSTLNKEACLMQASLVSMSITARHFNV
jgi:hypothetical protein